MITINKISQPVLVTGATGFIGSRVVSRLLDAGVRVRALVLPGEEIPGSWAGIVEIIRGSISDRAQVEKAASGAGTIIHLAAVVSDWGDEKKYWELTVGGSRSLFESAVRNDSRVVLVSSIVVYGDKIRKQVCAEDAGYGKTFGPYSRTKQAQEKLAWEFHRDRGMRLTVVRPSNVWGPRSGPWLHDVVDVIRSGSPGLISGGHMNAGLAYVDNVADIIILAAASGNSIGHTYNASDGLDITWKEFFSDIARMIGVKNLKSVPRPVAAFGAHTFEAAWKTLGIKKRPPITREALNLVGSDNRIPIDRVKLELGYNPRVSYPEGLLLTREYIEKNLLK